MKIAASKISAPFELPDPLGRSTADHITSFGTGVDSTVAKLGSRTTIRDTCRRPQATTAAAASSTRWPKTYDGFGQLTSDAQAHTGNVSGGTPSVGYSYDASNGDRLTGITYPNGRVVSYNYNGSGGLDTILNRVTSISNGSTGIQSYTYLGLNTPVTMTDGNGIKLTYGADGLAVLDQFGRVTDQNWQNSAGTSVDDFQYGYDANSNVLYKKNTVLASQSELFTYDSLNRLVTFERGTLNTSNASMSGGAIQGENWSLDALGNWLGDFTGSGGDLTGPTYDHNAQNQVTNIGGTDLSYDANGNLTTDQNGSTYVYNGWNQLVTAKNSSGGTIASYTYDALDRRITTTEGGTTTDNYFSNQSLIEQRQSGTMTSQFVWGPFYVNQLVQETNSGGTFYVHQDANWNVTSISNSSGSIVERYQYDPYGNVTVTDASGTVLGTGMISSAYGQIIGYQGGWTDPSTGLDHFRYRDDDTLLGRWIQPDPIGAAGSGTNSYQFELSNAVTGLDSTGLCDESSSLTSPHPFSIIDGLVYHGATSGTDNRSDLVLHSGRAGQTQAPHFLDEPIYGPPDSLTQQSLDMEERQKQIWAAQFAADHPYYDLSDVDLVKKLRELEQAKNDSYTNTGGKTDQTTAWLWGQILKVKAELESRKDTFWAYYSNWDEFDHQEYTPPKWEKPVVVGLTAISFLSGADAAAVAGLKGLSYAIKVGGIVVTTLRAIFQ